MGNSATEKTTVVDIEDIIDFYVKAYEVSVHRYEYYLDATKGKVALVLTVDEEPKLQMPEWMRCRHQNTYGRSDTMEEECGACGATRPMNRGLPWEAPRQKQ